MPYAVVLALAGCLALTSGPVVPSGGAVWPLDPRPPVVRGFDPPDSPWGAGHRGVDLLGQPGEVVRAARAGRITFAGRLAGRGVVVVDHGDVRTTYEPVAARVALGDRVGAGQAIGVLEPAMSHCFPRACLHWGLLRGATYLDPLSLLGAGPVRLLPLAGDPARASPPGWSPAPEQPSRFTPGTGGASFTLVRVSRPGSGPAPGERSDGPRRLLGQRRAGQETSGGHCASHRTGSQARGCARR